jgi:hypothetical protein
VPAARGLGAMCRALSLAVVGGSWLPQQLPIVCAACVVFCGVTVQAVSAVVLEGAAQDSDGDDDAADNDQADDVAADGGDGDGAGGGEETHQVPEYAASCLQEVRAVLGDGRGGREAFSLLHVVMQAADGMAQVLAVRTQAEGPEGAAARKGLRLLADTVTDYKPLLRRCRKNRIDIEAVRGHVLNLLLIEAYLIRVLCMMRLCLCRLTFLCSPSSGSAKG